MTVAGPALAADLPPPPPPPQAPATYVPVAAPVYNWSGIYFGVNAGYAFGSSAWTPAGTAGTGNFDVSGGQLGSTVGVNFQTGQFVFGVEGDIDWSPLKGSTSNTTTCVGMTCTLETQTDWLGTVRGRVGYAFDRMLVYATGGGAFGDIKATLTSPALAVSGLTSSTEFGWTAGAGVEYGITRNLTAKVEYLFVDLSKGSLACTAAVCGAAALTIPVSFDASLVRVGLNLKFDGF
jgi:outer membrane immunogenic protein